MTMTIESLEGRRLFATNLLANGSFESPAIGAGQSGQAFTTFATGQTVGSGWKVTAGSVDIVSDAAGLTYATKAAAGHQLIDMNGVQAGTLAQTAATVTGRRYRLRFAYTATPFRQGDSPDTRKLDVQFAGKTLASLSKSAVGPTSTNPGWTYVEYAVTAASSASAVTFLAKSAGSLGMAIDDVSLTEVATGTASISGQVFADGNGDGKKGEDAIGLSAWTVYIDANTNGKLDTGEIKTTTDRFGNYKLGSLSAGTYKVRVVQQTNWKLTTASSVSVTLTTGQASTGKLFGEQPV